MKDDNPPESITVPSPVVIFFKEEADKLVEKCPIDLVHDHDNIIAIMATTTAESITAGCADFIITHHTRNRKNGKTRDRGSWKVVVPLIRPDERQRHVFRVNLEEPKEDKKIVIDMPPPVRDPKLVTA